MNAAVLAALFFVHISFITVLGPPTLLLLLILSARFMVLVIELLWVQRLSPTSSELLIDLHVHLSIVLNIVCAFLAARSGGVADSHYSVLMLIPIISAAIRFTLVRTFAVICIAAFLSFVEVWMFFREHPPAEATEYFEAATVSLIFLAVGFVVWLLVRNLREEEEKLAFSLAELHAVQEKLVAEEKLAAVGQLSSAIAHEIRNPVTMIASSLRMADGAPVGSPLRMEMFHIATEEAKRLESLTTDFLAFARPREPHPQIMNICETLNYIGDLASAHLSEKDLDLQVECSVETDIVADAGQIQQALLNLLMNAINASSDGGHIKIGARCEDDRAVLWVENDGAAVPPEVVERMFEPFYTSDSKGTGLGLSIVQNIARAHGGEVRLVNNQPGHVRFEIKFQTYGTNTDN